MNITVIGGGNIGTSLSCYFKYINPQNRIILYTNHPEKFRKGSYTNIKCNDVEQNISYDLELDCITNNPKEAVWGTDIIYITVPHFAVEGIFFRIAPHIKNGTYIGVLPGGGGCEIFFKKYFGEKAFLFGFQRVPFTAKLVKYGQEVNIKSWKPYSIVGCIDIRLLDEVCRVIEECGLMTKRTENYLNIALTPTNPILHTPRTYELFKDYDRNHVFSSCPKFYVGWSDETSKLLFGIEKELRLLLDAIPDIDTSDISSLREHYESYSVKAMTEKINAIPTFQTVYAPMIKAPGGWIANTDSRLFQEDFPWGLAIFKAYCQLLDVPAPMMDRLLRWYADYMGVEWYVGDKFCGKDLKQTGIPARYGIQTKEELLAVYK